ncbi:uncharacterized protein RMCFA_5100 [Mycolicibacterium fortuitum subsp. acetamidolyticum]|uniref:Uncharacterized protein n=1 Tax=Mycolicibacterium fortuitum subsp. acetamidolyticum TaxID=144550 RepID=A0A124E529_MYCFO|nr:uncharacterized protein RMCFA_5100 [Mycolicibacterium fortuitum subsp. acetamidolyticum]
MTQPPNGWDNPFAPPPESGWQGPQPGQQAPMQLPGSWGPQYQQQFTPPPKKGGALKWVLGGTALVAVIAITAVVAISLSGRDNDKGSGPTTSAGSGSNSEFASANDTGPVTIITEDPSCAAWIPIQRTLAGRERNGWDKRDPSVPASEWSPEQRTQHEEVAEALRAAADQAGPLAKLTTHRAMRELYEQFIAYARAYADAIPTYTPPSDSLIRAAGTAGNVVTRICQAISFGSAAARAPLVPAGTAPKTVADPEDPSKPKRFLTKPDPVCPDLQTASDRFLADLADWLKTDPNIPASQWSPEQKALNEAVIPVISQSADALDELGQRTDNPTLQDFAALAAQYRRAYSQAIPTYTPADQHLYNAGLYPVGLVIQACNAAER